MTEHKIVDREAWVTARLELLEKEKTFTRERDALSAMRRELPWVKVDKSYAFETASGEKSLGDLFAGRSQLLVYHFMLGPDWEQGCKSCSFWADNFDGIDVHLAHRDVTFFTISSAPLAKIEPFKSRMGWSFDWVSSAPSDFNSDFNVSFEKADIAAGNANYNYKPMTFEMDEMAGISAFARAENGDVYHTYSTYGRGLDLLNGAYNYLDLVSKGRDEEGLEHSMSWLRHHDSY